MIYVNKIKSGLITAALVAVLAIPATASASGRGGSHHNWWTGWWSWFFGDASGETSGQDSATSAVPEFSAGAASGAAAILIGGTLILVSRKRKKEAK